MNDTVVQIKIKCERSGKEIILVSYKKEFWGSVRCLTDVLCPHCISGKGCDLTPKKEWFPNDPEHVKKHDSWSYDACYYERV